MRYLSLCSGIEAASEAWKEIPGWEAVAYAEIEKFPCAVLAHRYPLVRNLGDVTKITQQAVDGLGRVDLVVFGFPCQDLSVAGKRAGLEDADGKRTRSGLFYDCMRIVRWSRAEWFIAENVPGLLSSKGGVDFAAVLSEITGLAVSTPQGGWQNSGFVRTLVPGRHSVSWTVDDAQFAGVPQRRRRVFLVGHLGDDPSPVEVLLVGKGVHRDPTPRRKKREDVAGTLDARTDGGGFPGSDGACSGHVVPHPADAARPLKAHANCKHAEDQETLVTHTLKGEGHDASEDGTGRGVPIIPILEAGARTGKSTDDPRAGIGVGDDGDPMFTLQAGKQHAISTEKPIAFIDAMTPKASVDKAFTLTTPSPSGGGHPQSVCQPVAFSSKDHGADAGETCPTLRAGGHKDSHANSGVPPAVVVPIDMRQASRGEKMTNKRTEGSSGGAPGTGIGQEGDPAPTIAASHTPAVVYLAVLACVACGCSSMRIDEFSSLSPLVCSDCPTVKPIPFDTTQLTSPLNRSQPKPGDPCHPLAAGAHPPAIGFYPTNRQPENGNYEEKSPAIKVGSGGSYGNPPAVAFRAFGQEGFDASPVSPPILASDGGGVGTPTVVIQTQGGDIGVEEDMTQPLRSNCEYASGSAPMVFEPRVARNGRGAPEEVCPPLKAQSGETGKGDAAPCVVSRACVRRLTPRECERLQGFPDDYTLIPNWKHKPSREDQEEVVKYLLASGYSLEEATVLSRCPDGPRYKALGNSMAVPCMRIIGERIKAMGESA